ncbi:MAG: transposase, partial [bacterium]
MPRLPRRTRKEREAPKPVPPLPPVAADVNELDLSVGRTVECRAPLLFLFAPLLGEVGLDSIVKQARFPGTRMLPAATSVDSLLALKLLGRPRKNHATTLGEDPGLGLFAGLNVLPKTTAVHSYSYRVGPKMIRTLREEWVRAYGRVDAWEGDSFNLDFHAIRPYGEESELEKNYVPRRSQRVKSVLTVFVQEHASTTLVYADANLLKTDQKDEVVRFIEYWQAVTGHSPRELVFDSKGTTLEGLAEVARRKVRFITLRERRPEEIQRVKALPASAWKRVTLEAPERAWRHPRILDERITLTDFPGKIRQITAIDLGRPEPTFLLTNDLKRSPVTLLGRYVKRAIVENSIGEQVAFFHLDALSSDVRLKVDLDVVLSVIASNCYHWLAQRLKGYERVTAGTLWTKFLDRPG